MPCARACALMLHNQRGDKMNARLLQAVCLLLALCSIAIVPARAQQDYPNHPIRLVVPFAPAGVTDTSARVLADKLSRVTGQQVLVDNRPGASGNIGTQQVANSAPDGYTLLLAFDGTMVINPFVFPKIPF